MKTYKLDAVVKEALFDCHYSIHYYVFFLHYALTCLRELTFDTLKSVKTIRLTLNSYNAATLPSDFVGLARIGFESSENIREIGLGPSLNRLRKDDGAGGFAKFPDTPFDDESIPSGAIITGDFRDSYTNSSGEHIGRMYGFGAEFKYKYKILPERNQIQFSNDVPLNQVVVIDYFSDGFNSSTETLIDPFAVATIKAWIEWKRKYAQRLGRLEVEEAKREYIAQHTILKARKNPMTINDIVRTMRGSRSQSPKL